MALILETMSAFTTILKGSARPTNYQTLPTSDDDRPIGATGTGGEGKKHDAAVYLSFWLFGAGTLLGWSGTLLTAEAIPNGYMIGLTFQR